MIPSSILLFVLCSTLILQLSSGLKLDHHHKERMCRSLKFIPPFKTRAELGSILHMENKTIGIELGVQTGVFSKEVLTQWKTAEKYVMVDLWAKQVNYKDGANVEDSMHNYNFEQTKKRIEEMKSKGYVKEASFCRNLTSTCVHDYPNRYFDFVYVDARHDYKGVLEDLRNWWPKVQLGGIFAGHDYMTMADLKEAGNPDDWALNYDGTRDETGRVVRGAVDDFFSDRFGDMEGCPRSLTISFRENYFNSWAVRK